MPNEHILAKQIMESNEQTIVGINKHFESSEIISKYTGNTKVEVNIELPYYYASDLIQTEDLINLTWEEFSFIDAILFSMNIDNPWFTGQRKVYGISSPNNRPINSELLTSAPSDHYIQMDKKRKAIRLIGRNSGPEGNGGWLKLK
jgi:hypothetical protein